MHRLLRLFRWRSRARYWQRRCAAAEAQRATLTAQLNAELWRAVERGDMFASAAAFGSRGMFGIAPRSGPAVATPTPRAVPPPTPWDGFSGTDRMEFETIWLPDAERNGIDPRTAKAKFMVELANRRANPDVM